MTTKAEQVRLYVEQHYIRTARDQGRTRVRVPVRDVHDALGFENRFPLVCQAIKSSALAEEHRIRCVAVDGPDPSSTTVFTLQVDGAISRAEG